MANLIPRTIAVFTAECSENEEQNVLLGICSEAEKLGWRVLIFDALNNFCGTSTSELGTSIYKLLDFSTVSGVLITQNVMNYKDIGKNLVAECNAHNTPVISIGFKTDICPCYIFSSSDIQEQIVDHIIEKHNCKVLNLVAGIENNDFSEQRVSAFKKSLAKHGLEFDERRMFYGGFWDGPTKYGMKKFFETGLPLPDAFICCNDVMAMTVCQELSKQGIHVPDDVLVTGYDGVEFEQYHTPRLTTAKCDMKLLGKESLYAMISLINGNKIPDIQTVEPTIIFSQSCGCKTSNKFGENNFAIQAMALFGNYRHRTSMLNKFATLTSEIKDLKSIKPILPNNDFYGKDCWIMLNQNFQNFDENVSHTKENPFSEKMDCFWQVISDKQIEEPNPIDTNTYLPNLEKIFNMGLTNIVFINLYFGGESIGYIAVPFIDRNPSITLSSMERFAQSFSQCCSLVKNRSRLENLNSHDQLTQTYNRRGFFSELENMINNIDGENKSLIIHSIDMDELKFINDTFGHAEGDFAIKSLAQAITFAGGEKLVAARFGGDEFVAAEIIDSNSQETSENFYKKMKSYLNNTNETSGKPYKISASCGTYTTPLPLTNKLDKIIMQADSLMYKDKSEKKKTRQNQDT